MKKQLWTALKYSINGLLLTLLLWVTLGNLIATVAKRETDAKLEQAIEDGLEKLPQYNDSALQLFALTLPLGINLSGSTNYEIDQPLNQQAERSFESGTQDEDWDKIRNELSDYIDAQVYSSNDTLDPLPETVQQYLERYQAEIRAVQNHLATQTAPVWGMPDEAILSLREGNPTAVALPSRLNQADLNRVLLAQLIQDSFDRNSPEIALGAQATVNFAHALSSGSTLIDRLVVLINERATLGILRKTEGLDSSLLEPWLAHDYAQGMMDSIQTEAFITYIIFSRLLVENIRIWDEIGSKPNQTPQSSHYAYATTEISPTWPLVRPVARPYLIFAALDTFAAFEVYFTQASTQLPSPCDPNLPIDRTPYAVQDPSWWNIPGQISFPSFLNQTAKAQQHQLAIELTHHVLTAKQIAADTGQWPATLPNLESKTCPGVTWQYEATPQGSMSLKLPSYAPWLQNNLTPDPTTGKISGSPLEVEIELPPS